MKTPSRLVSSLAALCVAAHWAQADPAITVQPRNLAVFPGSTAVFRVTAAGAEPVTYQWQRDRRDLEGATNATLTLTNVTLAVLGAYSVTIRDLAGETTSEAAWLKLARWTDLVVFDAGISMASASNGKSWVEWFAETTGLTAPGQVKNYATGGASCAVAREQISRYLESFTPNANTLLAPWWAGMSADLVWNRRPVSAVVSNYSANITQLARGGGKLFVLPNLVPLDLNPGLDSAYARQLDYADINARMDQEIEKIQTEFGLTVFRFDYWGFCTNLLAEPERYGFTNATLAAQTSCPPGDPDQFFWWDGVHPTTAGHRVTAEAIYRCLTPPLVMAVPVWNGAGTWTFRWEGGSGPFRLQMSRDVVSFGWGALDQGTFERSVRQGFWPADQRFFRILQLGQ